MISINFMPNQNLCAIILKDSEKLSFDIQIKHG